MATNDGKQPTFCIGRARRTVRPPDIPEVCTMCALRQYHSHCAWGSPITTRAKNKPHCAAKDFPEQTAQLLLYLPSYSTVRCTCLQAVNSHTITYCSGGVLARRASFLDHSLAVPVPPSPHTHHRTICPQELRGDAHPSEFVPFYWGPPRRQGLCSQSAHFLAAEKESIGRKNATLTACQQYYVDVHGWYRARIEQLFTRLWHWGLLRNIWRGGPDELRQSVYILLHFFEFCIPRQTCHRLYRPCNHVAPHVWTNESNSATTEDEGHDEVEVCELCCHKRSTVTVCGECKEHYCCECNDTHTCGNNIIC